MRNQYPGICYFCGQYIAPHEGHFERQIGKRTKWKSIHFDCVFKQRQLKHCIKSMMMARMMMDWITYFWYRRQAYFIVKSLPNKDKSLINWPWRNVLCNAVDLHNGWLDWVGV